MAKIWDSLPVDRGLSGSYPVQSLSATERDCNDMELISRVACGDERSFGMLYARYNKPIHNYLKRLVNDQETAEDLLQEVFVGVWQGAARFQGKSQVKNWIFRIAHNQAVSWLRRNRDHTSLEEEGETSMDGFDLEEQAESLSDSMRITVALARLSPKHRSVLELAFAHEMSYKEISEVVGCPVGTVKSRMSHAIAQLAAILGLDEK